MPVPLPDAGPPRDGGLGDGSIQPDAGLDGGRLDGAIDAGSDAATMDAGPRDSGTLMESGVELLDGGPPPDALPIDGGGTEDAGSCLRPDGTFDYCGCAETPPCSSDAECGMDLRCTVDPGCGVSRCTIASHNCLDAADCAAGSECTRGRCVRSGGGCGDSRDCPVGYECSSAGACVAHRVACSSSENCPLGYYCETTASGGHPFCNRAFRPCTSAEACFTRALCRDVDGDGARECLRPGLCATNADCPAAGEVCGMIFEAATTCTSRGYCQSVADCPSGHQCVDAGGVRLCVPSGGGCQKSADCPAGAICGSATIAAPQTCISAPL